MARCHRCVQLTWQIQTQVWVVLWPHSEPPGSRFNSHTIAWAGPFQIKHQVPVTRGKFLDTHRPDPWLNTRRKRASRSNRQFRRVRHLWTNIKPPTSRQNGRQRYPSANDNTASRAPRANVSLIELVHACASNTPPLSAGAYETCRPAGGFAWARFTRPMAQPTHLARTTHTSHIFPLKSGAVAIHCGAGCRRRM